MRLNDKRFLITGGAQGIGKEIALIIADEGGEVLLTDIQQDKLDATREEIVRRGGRCHGYLMDVTNVDSIQKAKEEIHKDGGPIDVLFNNAGIVFGGAFLEVPIEKHFSIYQVNTHGMVAVTHAFLPDLIGRREARLVNIASASGFIGLPFGTTYASSKWAAIGFSESIRLELKQMGYKQVSVTTVCPSYVGTGMFGGVRAPLLTKLLDPKKLAHRIVLAMKKKEIIVLEPWLVKMTPLLKGLLPPSMVDIISDIMGVNASMTEWHGHGNGS